MNSKPTYLFLRLLAPFLGAVFLADASANEEWLINSQAEWSAALAGHTNLEVVDGSVVPTAHQASFTSVFKQFEDVRKLDSIKFSQSAVWENWEPIRFVQPNLSDAPVLLSMGPKNYWMFGRYNSVEKMQQREARAKARTGASNPYADYQLDSFVPEAATLEGFDMPLLTTPYPNQFTAPGGLEFPEQAYHGWQSKDMVNWVHHGSVTKGRAYLVTSAEMVGDHVYFYYDYPNDQDPHLVIDRDLTDGIAGEDLGMVFQDPSDGSDSAIIRGLDGKFHLILEDWSPVNASTHAWDSPLAMHAVSDDGIKDFKILEPPVDERTTPTGQFAEYAHPHWHASDPKSYPGKPSPVDVPQHRIKAGDVMAFAQYEIHEPEQNAYGDWAAIAIGGQHYLFCDYDPVGGNGQKSMSVGLFTASSIDGPFEWCGHVGQGHPDPDIMFAEGRFYLATQTGSDFVSPGPWVETVEVRVGVDTTNDGVVDQWSQWQAVSEQYDYIPGFAKQVAKTPAQMDLSGLPAGYGFQFEVRMTDTTENDSKPILDQMTLSFAEPLL